MKRLLLTILTALLLGATALTAAQLSPQRTAEVVADINRATAQLNSMSCRFVQTKHLSLLSDKMVSEGRMDYSRADKLRWEYTSPYSYLFLLNGPKVYVGNQSKSDVIDTNTNKLFKEVARIMMSTVTGTALSNAADFTVSAAETATHWQITLVPKKKELKQMFRKIELVFSKADKMIAEINLFEKNSSDRTNIRLTDITVNRPVDATVFAIP